MWLVDVIVSEKNPVLVLGLEADRLAEQTVYAILAYEVFKG